MHVQRSLANARFRWLCNWRSQVLVGCLTAALCGCSSESAPGGNPAGSGQGRIPRGRVPETVQVMARRTAQGYEIEVQGPQAIPPRDITPALRIGDHEFGQSRESLTVGFHGIVFLLSDAEFEVLPDGSAISLGYGETSHPGLTFHGEVVGRLNKNAVGW